MRWEDIDWHRRIILVRRSKVLDHDDIAKDRCKTLSSAREVMLLEPALQALTQQKQHTFLADEFIFHNPNTNREWHSHRAYLRCWSHCVRRAKLSDHTGNSQIVRYRPPKNTLYYQKEKTYSGYQNNSVTQTLASHSSIMRVGYRM